MSDAILFERRGIVGRFFRFQFGTIVLLSLLASPLTAQKRTASPSPIHVKVVVVAMFEVGEDTGDTPGEYQPHPLDVAGIAERF